MIRGIQTERTRELIEKLQYITKHTQLTLGQVKQVLRLLEEGNTLAFIARYRKEQTQGVSENKIRQIETFVTEYEALEKRSDYIRRKIKAKGERTEGDLVKLGKCESMKELENIYEAYREKTNRKVSEAVEKGYQPIYTEIKQDVLNISYTELLSKLKQVGKDEEGKRTEPEAEVEEQIEQGLTYVKELWKEEICTNTEIRQRIQEYYETHVKVISRVLRKELDTVKKYEKYYDYQEPLQKITSTRMYAMLRGESEGILKLTYDIDRQSMYELIRHNLNIDIEDIQDKKIQELLEQIVKESYTTRLRATTSRVTKVTKMKECENESIEIFSKNLHQKLLASPYQNQIILALDPGYRNGCKLAIVNRESEVQLTETLYLFDGRKLPKSLERMDGLLDTYDVTHIVLGNGAASKETLEIVKRVLKERTAQSKYAPSYEIVDESGASVYSASKIGYDEFPTVAVECRSAINLARRVQDPLAELVKVPPASLGIGEYQHMLDEGLLSKKLEIEVTSIVNRVGVDINTASEHLLKHVSGLTPILAKNIVMHREKYGRFNCRENLLQVKGIGERIYEQAVGFLRVYGGEKVLDSTGIHPKDYIRLESLLSTFKCDIEEISDEEKLKIKETENYFVKEYEKELGELETTSREYYLLEELSYSLYDIRDERTLPTYQHIEFEDLKIGMRVEGIIRNLTTFAAFVDIGLKNAGFLHISEVKEGYIPSIFTELSIGEHHTFYIKTIDKENKKVTLTRKSIGENLN